MYVLRLNHDINCQYFTVYCTTEFVLKIFPEIKYFSMNSSVWNNYTLITFDWEKVNNKKNTRESPDPARSFREFLQKETT